MNISHHDIKGRKPNQTLGGSRVNVGDLERRRTDTLVPLIRYQIQEKRRSLATYRGEPIIETPGKTAGLDQEAREDQALGRS